MRTVACQFNSEQWSAQRTLRSSAQKRAEASKVGDGQRASSCSAGCVRADGDECGRFGYAVVAHGVDGGLVFSAESAIDGFFEQASCSRRFKQLGHPLGRFVICLFKKNKKPATLALCSDTGLVVNRQPTDS